MNARAAHVGSSRPEGPTHLLVADADDTLLGDANALEDFARWYRDQSAWLAIAYASGRSVESLTRSVDEPHATQRSAPSLPYPARPSSARSNSTAAWTCWTRSAWSSSASARW